MNIDLTQFDFDTTESAVYMALLQLGQSSVTEITEHAGITRTLGYHTLDRLETKGLIDQIGTEGKKMFRVKHPRALEQYIAKKEATWQKKHAKVQSLLPELTQLYVADDAPAVRFKEGVSGIKELFEEKLQQDQEVLSVLDVESWQTDEFWDWAQEYHTRRTRKHINERILLLDTPAGRTWVDNYFRIPRHTTYRWISTETAKKLLQFEGVVDIYGDNVMISLLKTRKKMGIIIEGGILANILRAMFELAWESAEPVAFTK